MRRPPDPRQLFDLDALRRELSDPGTPAARLSALATEAFDRLEPSPLETAPPPLVANANELLDMLASNPALPLPTLDALLRAHCSWSFTTVAWHNPAVPLLLVSDPSYAEHATTLLRDYRDHAEGDDQLRDLDYEGNRATCRPAGEDSLAAAVRDWADETYLPTCQHDDARDLARHLAGLFGLPWPAGS
jgi:hypothetical protein